MCRNIASRIARRKKILGRFRRIVRMVTCNKVWLSDLDDTKVSTNLRRNIAMLVRQETKIGLLTMAEKALLRRPVFMRTVEERKKLVNLVMNLTCFSRFPPKIRARLSSIVSFLYVAPYRRIVRQGDNPYAVYYIMTGEAEVTRRTFDLTTNAYIDKLVHICGPGDCIGEVEATARCPRLLTTTSSNNMELLVIYMDDFDVVLRPFMEKQLEQKKIALGLFDYFKNWTKDQIFYACKVGILRQYESLETIYYEDKGPLTYVHFVISGQCMILQCLKVKALQKNGKKSYKLVEIAKGESANLFNELTNEEILKKLNESKMETTAEEVEDSELSSTESQENEEEQEEIAGVYKKARKSDYKRYALSCGVDLRTPAEIEADRRALKRASTLSESPQSSQRESKTSKGSLESTPGDVPVTTTPRPSAEQPTARPSQDLKKDPPGTKIENHFIDVGSLTIGGIFGLGEQLEHRVIMARTTVQCLLIPRFWLLEKSQNPGNIWQRMRFYLDSTIPTREILFQDFKATRKWLHFKKELISGFVDSSKVGNPTKLQDIPIICRIVEANDDDDEDDDVT